MALRNFGNMADARCFELRCPTSSVASSYCLIAENEAEATGWIDKIEQVTNQLLESKPVYKVQREKFQQRLQERESLSKKELKKLANEEKKEQKKIKGTKTAERFAF